MVDGMKYECGSLVKVYWQGNQSTWRTTCTIATLFTINPTWTTWD